jgi:hypothetical protein
MFVSAAMGKYGMVSTFGGGVHFRPRLNAVRSIESSRLHVDSLLPSAKRWRRYFPEDGGSQVCALAVPKERPDIGFHHEAPDFFRRSFDVGLSVFERSSGSSHM